MERQWKKRTRRKKQQKQNGTEILHSEIRYAMKTMRKGQAVGKDEIAIEILEALDEFAKDTLVKLTNKIYETGNITKEVSK